MTIDVYFATRGKGDYQIDYVPAPRVTEADKNNDKRYKWILKILQLFFSLELGIVWKELC